MSEEKYTTIQIAEEDRTRLLGIALDIMKFNGQEEPMNPVSCIHHAINALEEQFKHIECAITEEEKDGVTLQ